MDLRSCSGRNPSLAGNAHIKHVVLIPWGQNKSFGTIGTPIFRPSPWWISKPLKTSIQNELRRWMKPAGTCSFKKFTCNSNILKRRFENYDRKLCSYHFGAEGVAHLLHVVPQTGKGVISQNKDMKLKSVVRQLKKTCLCLSCSWCWEDTPSQSANATNFYKQAGINDYLNLLQPCWSD